MTCLWPTLKRVLVPHVDEGMGEVVDVGVGQGVGMGQGVGVGQGAGVGMGEDVGVGHGGNENERGLEMDVDVGRG